MVARGLRIRLLAGLQGFGGTIVVLSDVGSFLLLSPPIHGGARRTGGLSAGTMHLVPLIPARLRKTSGALIVTVVVTIQGSARALKHARAPSRPGTNGGAPVESRDPQVA